MPTLRPRTLTARRLRRDATDVEQKLWRALRENGLPWKFRRQHPIGKRVVDFACPARKLAIELDGGQHAGQTEADTARTADLARHGYRVHPLLEWRRSRKPRRCARNNSRRACGEPHLTPALSAPRGRRGRHIPRIRKTAWLNLLPSRPSTRTTTPVRSRCCAGSTPCASARACISATPTTARACTTWSTRWWTIRSTRRSPAIATPSPSP